MKKLNVGIIGCKFMGKAHSNAWKNAPCFFKMDAAPVMKVACGRHREPLQEFADRWGWEEIETDWRKVVERDDIDIVDVSVPQHLHYEVVMAAIENNKHIFCEKPLAMTYAQCKGMNEAATEKGIVNYVNHNYRRCPSVMLAKRLIDLGKIGRIFHWRGAYLQSWILDPNFPLTWHLQKDKAGMGPQGDLNSHSVDLARFLVGDIKSVCCMTSRFIEERPLPDEAASGTFKGAVQHNNAQIGKVTVEDAAFMVAEFKNGALGSFDTTRFASGRKNYNYFEIYGSEGSILFDFERMNELRFFSNSDSKCAQGFRTILVTESCHDYIGNWWPPGHVIGYEHAFTHAVVDFIEAVANGKEISPNFYDGMKEMEVLEAGMKSAETGRKIVLD